MIILDKKQAQQNISCPAYNGTMAAAQTERGAFFVCGACGEESLITARGTVEE